MRNLAADLMIAFGPTEVILIGLPVLAIVVVLLVVYYSGPRGWR